MQDRQKIGVSLAESGFNGQFTIAEVKKILAKCIRNSDETWFMRECRELDMPEGKQLKSEFSNGMKAKLRVLDRAVTQSTASDSRRADRRP